MPHTLPSPSQSSVHRQKTHTLPAIFCQELTDRRCTVENARARAAMAMGWVWIISSVVPKTYITSRLSDSFHGADRSSPKRKGLESSESTDTKDPKTLPRRSPGDTSPAVAVAVAVEVAVAVAVAAARLDAGGLVFRALVLASVRYAGLCSTMV